MTPSWKLVVACDSAGVEYKTAIMKDLHSDPRVTNVIDVGVSKDGEDKSTDYPHVAVAAARKIMDGEADRGLLICGTGMGVAISANKIVSSQPWLAFEN